MTNRINDSDETSKRMLSKYEESANGFAFLSSAPAFANAKGEPLTIKVDNFALASRNVLEGKIIRCSDHDGVYIVGCQRIMCILWNISRAD